MDTVTSFSSTITHGDHVSATENFLACFVHEKITHLEFDFRWIDLDNEGRVHWNNIDLSTFTAIHSVRVHIPLQFTYGPENLKAAWSIMLALFDKLEMPSLTEISIHFHFSVVRMAADDDESEKRENENQARLLPHVELLSYRINGTPCWNGTSCRRGYKD
ncbi:hypothetical protein QCA50_007628 [Cerrena zonata]|uniref:EF-hand domain-containing protein n=1 Tax=Cerrena zonata TaxID=2478898 RepID=A0AAW0GBJ9_9APHY